MTEKTVVADFYVVLIPERSTWAPHSVRGVKATHLRQSKPKLNQGEAAVRVKLRIPVSALEEWSPVVEADVDRTAGIVPEVDIVHQGPALHPDGYPVDEMGG